MITLLLVSHSHEVAQGVRRLAAQMAPPELTILAVGGLRQVANSAEGCSTQMHSTEEQGASEAAHPEMAAQETYVLGSDVHAIVAAIQKGWSPAGVLILADLGSSIMSAETALELLPPHMAQACCISNAPLVEGAIVAAVEAGLGHDLETVNQAAEATAGLIKVHRDQTGPVQC